MKPNAARKGTSSRNDRCLNRALGCSRNEAICPKLKAKELLYKWDRADFLQLQRSKTLIVILPSPDTFGTAKMYTRVPFCHWATLSAQSSKSMKLSKVQFDAASRQGRLTQGRLVDPKKLLLSQQDLLDNLATAWWNMLGRVIAWTLHPQIAATCSDQIHFVRKSVVQFCYAFPVSVFNSNGICRSWQKLPRTSGTGTWTAFVFWHLNYIDLQMCIKYDQVQIW